MPNSTTIRHQPLPADLTLILLDRDGVINADSPAFIKNPDEWHILPGAADAIARLQQRFDVAVCTNQSGIGRGLFDLADLAAIHTKMQQTLTTHNASAIDIFFCPHSPDAGCQCRKPLPGLLHLAMQHFGASPAQTLFAGDSPRDIQAGQAAGCHVAIVETGHGVQTASSMPEVSSTADLEALANLLLSD